MGIANAQNMTRAVPVLPQPYGIRVRLRRGDPFAKLLGADWQRTHWFFTAAERDRMLEDMSRKHEYSREGGETGRKPRVLTAPGSIGRRGRPAQKVRPRNK
jgi:hypothetical protein